MLEFVGRLKVMLFSGDFTDHYNYRIARIICFLCKSMESFECLRCLVWDLIAAKNDFMPLSFHKIIILFARKVFVLLVYRDRLHSDHLIAALYRLLKIKKML